MLALYYLSLSVVICAAIVIALHPDIPGGFIGSTLLGGVAVCGMAGFDWTPNRWLVGFMCFLAASCLWALARWHHCRRRRAPRGGLERRRREWVR